jgi:uncharacterized protein YjbJ (UPF0337 family)
MKDKWEQIAGQWKQFASEVRKKWSELTDEEVSQINGDRKILVALLQKRYGLAKKKADKQVEIWANTLKV